MEDILIRNTTAILPGENGPEGRRCSIAVRGGLHCAPSAHRSLGTFPEGSLRVSPGYFNTPPEIDAFLAALAEIVRK